MTPPIPLGISEESGVLAFFYITHYNGYVYKEHNNSRKNYVVQKCLFIYISENFSRKIVTLNPS